jgi:hypothetical protein
VYIAATAAVTILRLGAGRNDGGYENKNLKPADAFGSRADAGRVTRATPVHNIISSHGPS